MGGPPRLRPHPRLLARGDWTSGIVGSVQKLCGDVNRGFVDCITLLLEEKMMVMMTVGNRGWEKVTKESVKEWVGARWV